MNIVSWLETLNSLGYQTMRTLLSLLWQSSILLAAAALLTYVLRRRRASVRHALWIVALLAVPALPLLAWVGSSINAPQAEIPVMPCYRVPPALSPLAPVEFHEPPPSESTPPPVALEAEEEREFSLLAYPWALALLLYSTGLILFLSLVIAGRLRIWRWIRNGSVLTDTRVLSAFQTARQQFGLRRRFLLVENKQVQAPMTIRTFRPVVLLPTGLCRNLSESELQAVAIHEMAHIKRNDPLLLTLASFVRAVLFFHPLIWLACRQISLLAEQVADDAVLDATGEALPYAQMLARLAEDVTRRSLSTELAAGIVLSKSAFLHRVEAILSDRRQAIRKLSRLALLGTILATIISLALATALPLGQKPPAEAPAVEIEILPAAEEPWVEAAQPAEDKDSPNTDLSSGESSTDRRIFGLVVDTEGRPVAGARVSAWSYASGQLLNPTMLQTHTDENGRFDVVVPFADVRYSLHIRKGGFFSKSANVLSGDGPEIELVLKTGPTHMLTGTVKDAETGAPARDARVLLIGEYVFRGDVKTDETGHFEIQGIPNSIGKGVLYARANGRISPLRTVSGRDKHIEVGLGLPARLKGIVKEEVSGKPLAGCTVTAGPWFASPFSIQTTTGDDGRFELTGLPPGKYVVAALSDNYYEPPTRGTFLERPDVPLNPGVTQFYQIALREKATVKGQVLGPDGRPARDAVVGTRATWDWDGAKQWCTARVDKQGRFVLRSGRLHRRETVEAFSSWYGSGSATVEGLTEGETRENVTIRLSGAARVRGVVTDPSGVPLKNISVERGWQSGVLDVTEEDGRFDLGRIALPTSKYRAEIKFRSPRPHRGDLHMWRDDGSRRPAVKPEPAARFFHHKSVPFQAAHGEEVNLEVALEPTEVLTFSGKVLDHAGRPVQGAPVILFAGNARAETLRSTLHPNHLEEMPIGSRRRPMPLCLTITDDQGKWAMWVVRETEEDLKILHWFPPNAPCYSVGVEAPEGHSTIVKDIVLEEGQTEKAIEVRLGKPPAEETISGRVVDANGNPLCGIQLRLGVPTRVVTTGADGGFLFTNPGARRIIVWVQTKGWSVVSPESGWARRSFELAGGKDQVRNVQVILAEDGSVSGTVRWESGKPVVNYTVSSGPHRLNVSNAQGVFRLEGIPSGEHFLSVRTPEGVFGRQQIKVRPGASVETEVTLPLPEYTIRGWVTDATGAAVAGVTVTLSGKRCHTEALNDEEGRFTFRVPAGTYRLTTSADLSKPGRDRKRTTVKVGGDVKEVEVRLVVSLPQPGHFKLRLIDKENRPLPGIKVKKYDTDRTYSTDMDGWCVVRGLAPKRYIFWVSDEEQLKNEHMRLTVHIEGGKTTTLEIRLGEGLRVSGRVICASEPAPNVHVWMSTEDGRRNSAAHTGPDGRFQFINLPEGRLSVKCTPYETKQPVTESLHLQADVDDLVIHLPTGRILGRLLDYRGRPLLDCDVRVTCLDEPAESRRQFTRPCDEGHLDLKYLKDGKYLLELMQDRSVLASYGPVTISGGETLRDVVIQEPGESSEAQHAPAAQSAAKSDETAWGEVVDGLQAGLSLGLGEGLARRRKLACLCRGGPAAMGRQGIGSQRGCDSYLVARSGLEGRIVQVKIPFARPRLYGSPTDEQTSQGQFPCREGGESLFNILRALLAVQPDLSSDHRRFLHRRPSLLSVAPLEQPVRRKPDRPALV